VAVAPVDADSPLASGAKAVGIAPGEGRILPGSYAGAVFVYATEEQADRALQSLARLYGDASRHGGAVVVYSPAPSVATRNRVDSCLP
jgi:hypothetical protein